MREDDPDSDEVAATVPGHIAPARRSSKANNLQATLVGGEAGSLPPRAAGPFRFLRQPEKDDEIGRLGNYRVLRLLGRGGMAFVFLAEDMSLHRRVALKVMKPDLERDPTASQRFLHEARLLASIKHDHLVTVYQVGSEGNVVFLAMELLQGETLESRLERSGPPRANEIIRLGREMATGLGIIHQNGLIHRDIKPGNIWLEEPGKRIKLLDFGLARHVDDDARFTQSGNIVGTPAYMSPEQARGVPMDARSDLFSLGGVLYHVCTGRMPFEAPTTMGMLTALAVDTPRPIHEFNPNVPKRLVQLVNDLLAKNADDRPASAQIVVDRLLQIETHPQSEADSADWDFDEADTVAIEPAPIARYHRRQRANKQRMIWWSAGIAVGVMFIACVALIAVLSSSKSPKTSESSGTATPTPPGPSQPYVRKDTPSVQPKVQPVPVAEGRKAYLSDMQAIDIRDWAKFLPPMGKKDGPGNMPPMDFVSVYYDGKAMPHGVFMHPPLGPSGGTASGSYRLAKKYETFRTDVSIADGPQKSETPLVFVVYGDDRELWRSKPVSTQSERQSCNVSIRDVDKLKIAVECPGDSRGAHAAWLDPFVTMK